MDFVKRLDYGCGDVWVIHDFEKNEYLSNFFLDQCISFCQGASAFVDHYVKNVDQDITDEKLDHILLLASNYNKGSVALCRSLQELYDLLVSQYVFATDGGCSYSLDGSDKFEPLYNYTSATKQAKLIALILYHHNIQTNISYIEDVVRFIDNYVSQDNQQH